MPPARTRQWLEVSTKRKGDALWWAALAPSWFGSSMPGRACAMRLNKALTLWPALADVSINMTLLYSLARCSPSSVDTSLGLDA